MKILVVNPNTTVAVTERFVAEARRTAPPGTVIDGVTGRFGASIVSTQAENAVAGHSVLELLARHGAGYDAAILAISFDTALDAAREAMPIPVVGITGAALAEAAALAGSRSIGLVTFGAVSDPLYDQLLARGGFAGRVAARETVGIGTAAGYLDETDRDDRLVEAALRLAARPGIGAIVVCGAAIVGAARRLQPRLPLPLLDGAAPSVAAARYLAAAGGPPPSLPRPLAGSSGLDPALARLLAGGGPTSPASKDRP